MTFEEANAKWKSIVGNPKLTAKDLELMKQFFFKMGENEGVKKVGQVTGLGKGSWDTNPDRMGGQFTEEEKKEQW